MRGCFLVPGEQGETPPRLGWAEEEVPEPPGQTGPGLDRWVDTQHACPCDPQANNQGPVVLGYA